MTNKQPPPAAPEQVAEQKGGRCEHEFERYKNTPYCAVKINFGARCGPRQEAHVTAAPATTVAQPAADPVAGTLGDAWREWFRRTGQHATPEVVNATATLVIAERSALNERIRASTIPPPTVAVEGAKLRRIVCEVVHQHVPVTVQLPHGINGLEEALVDAFSRYLVAQQPQDPCAAAGYHVCGPG